MRNFNNELESQKHLAESFYFKGSEVAVLLVHGFTASPTETLPLGRFLHEKGFTVHGVRLAGHGTDYRELPKYTWHDWYNSVETGFIFLKDHCKTVIPIGVSMGATLCLLLIHKHPNQFTKLVMLAPIFASKSRLMWLMPILKLFKKNLFKGEDTVEFYKTHNLYSYIYYPTESIIQLTSLLNYIKKEPINVNVHTLIAYGLLDDTVSIPAIERARKQKFSADTEIEILKLPKSAHILTVEPDSEELFQAIELFLKN